MGQWPGEFAHTSLASSPCQVKTSIFDAPPSTTTKHRGRLVHEIPMCQQTSVLDVDITMADVRFMRERIIALDAQLQGAAPAVSLPTVSSMPLHRLDLKHPSTSHLQWNMRECLSTPWVKVLLFLLQFSSPLLRLRFLLLPHPLSSSSLAPSLHLPTW